MADISKVIQEFLDREAAVGDFIANGPGEGIQGYARDGYRHRCNELANVPAWARALGGLAFGSASRICKPYWDDQGVDGPVNEPPFTGGQCDAELYIGSITYDSGSGPTTAYFKAYGPIGGFIAGENSSGFPGYGLVSRGDQIRTGTPYTCGGIPPTLRASGYRQFVNGENFEGISVSVSGSCAATPGDCGDPPPERKPGTNPPADPGPLPGPEPTDDPFGGPFPVFPIPPYDDPVGGPTPIEPPPDPSGGGGGGAGGTAGGDGLPGEGDAVGGAAGSAAGGEDGEDVDFGTPPDGKVWVGALIECTVDSRLGNIPGTGPQNTVYPTAIANASLKYSTGYGKSVVIRSKWTDIVRPVTALVVEGCFIQAQPGVSASVRPISATICPDNPCEEETDG